MLRFGRFFLRFATMRRRILGSVSENAYGIYLFHYVFVVWTQYTLLQVPMPAVVKGTIVLSVTLALSWAASAGVEQRPGWRSSDTGRTTRINGLSACVQK